MSTDVTRDFAFGLPKAELHLHLEGTLEPDLKLALARKNGVDIGQSTVEEVQATYQFNDLTSFLAVYYPAMDVLQDEDDFHDLAAAYFERARANGVVRAECFFDPQAHTSRGIAIETVIRGYHRAVVEAREAGLDVRIAKVPTAAIPRAKTMRYAGEGFWKAVVDANTHQILGATLIGPNVSEVITAVHVAMAGGLTYEQLRFLPIAHPTLGEGLQVLFDSLS